MSHESEHPDMVDFLTRAERVARAVVVVVEAGIALHSAAQKLREAFE